MNLKRFQYSAFTIYEFLIVMIIVSSLAVIAIPIWFGANYQLRTTTDQLIQSILFIQQSAMNEGKNTFISFDGTLNSYAGFRRDGSGNTQILPTCFVKNTITLNSTQTNMEFDGVHGLPLTSSPTYEIDLITADKTVHISINSFGEITLT